MNPSFMDKSIEYTPEAILAACKEFYENILAKPEFRDLRT